MKILQLGKFFPIEGGVEKVMLDLTTGISNREIYCDMMSSASTPELEKPIELGKFGRILPCETLIKLNSTMLSPCMVARLRKICHEYDIIHVHHPDPMAAVALYFSGYKGKVILHWHSDILKQKVSLQFYKPLQKWLIKRADLIVGTTPVYIEESPYLKKFQYKTTYLPIGIDPTIPNAREAEEIRAQYPGKKIVFSLGRLIEYKGFKYLIDAASLLSDDYVVLIGGKGPLEEELRLQITEKGLSDKVKLLGRISEEVKNACFGACDVFCMSSIMKTEAFGIVQLEAMSCGKPVVATNIAGSGVSWVNEHGFSGLNAEPENAAELAGAIAEICNNQAAYETYCNNAKIRYDDFFTMDEMINRCTFIYNNLLHAREVRSIIPAGAQTQTVG
ncbi:MAG: glycosyltransferase [Bacteroidia bacterium]|nr:glycosyltransferase [Bacteroidia bacterium]